MRKFSFISIVFSIFISVLVSVFVFNSCALRSRKGQDSSNKSNVAGANAAAVSPSEINSAIQDLHKTLQNAPQAPAAASETTTVSDTVNDLNTLSKNISSLSEADLMTLYQSDAFAKLKHDVREASNTTNTSSQSGTNSSATSTSTATGSSESSSNWFSWIEDTSSGNTQLTVVGGGLFLALAVWNYVAAHHIDYAKGKSLWPDRKFFAGIAFARAAVGMGLSAGFVVLALGGVSGDWSNQTFQTAEGALMLVDGVTMSIVAFVSFYEMARKKQAPIGSFADLLLDPSRRADLKEVEELKMKKEFYQFLTQKGNLSADQRAIKKGLSKTDLEKINQLLSTNLDKLPNSAIEDLNNKIKNPYVKYYSYSVSDKKTKVAQNNKNAESKSLVETYKGRPGEKVRVNKEIITQRSLLKVGMGCVLALGVLQTVVGSYKLSTNDTTPTQGALALVETEDPSTQFFRDLNAKMEALFALHDREHGDM